MWQILRKKIFFTLFFVFSFFCVCAETPLQSLFFEASKCAATGICVNPEARALAAVSQKNIKRFYTARFALFDENHHFVSLYIAEVLAKNHIGEIDCLYDENDFVAFAEEKIDIEDNEKSDSGKSSALSDFAGDWIDQAIALSAMQTSQPRTQVNDGQSLLDYLEKGDSRGIAEQNEEKLYAEDESEDVEKPEEKKEFTYSDKSGLLRRFFYDGEGMSVNSYGENIYITKNYGNEISRKCFDSEFRLSSEEKFSFGANPKNVALIGLKTYIYEETSKIPSEMKEIRFPQKKSDEASQKDGEIEIETKFNESGLASEIKTGHWEEIYQDKTAETKNQKPENEKKREPEVKFFDDKLETYLYDVQNRILEYGLETWTYKKNQFGKTTAQSLKTKYEYFYHDDEKSEDSSSSGNIPPDYKFYENGELRMERNYSASDDFTEKMIFSDGFYVEALYRDGIKRQEIVYNNGKESRRREF